MQQGHQEKGASFLQFPSKRKPYYRISTLCSLCTVCTDIIATTIFGSRKHGESLGICLIHLSPTGCHVHCGIQPQYQKR